MIAHHSTHTARLKVRGPVSCTPPRKSIAWSRRPPELLFDFGLCVRRTLFSAVRTSIRADPPSEEPHRVSRNQRSLRTRRLPAAQPH